MPDRSSDTGSVLHQAQAKQTDTIYMKNGSILRGTVSSFQNGVFTIILSGVESRAIIHVDDVERIEFVTAPPSSMEESSKVPSSRDEPQTVASPTSTPPPAPKDGPPPAETTTPPRTDPLPATGQTPLTAPTESKDKPTTPASVTEPVKSPDPEPAATKPELPTFREIMVQVSGQDVWADSGVDVAKGDRLRFSASGRVSLSRAQTTGPEGVNIADPRKMMPDRPTGGLIAVIGDDNDEFVFIGAAREFVAQRSGRLFLMVNEDNLDDNSGSFNVRIQLEHPPSSDSQ